MESFVKFMLSPCRPMNVPLSDPIRIRNVGNFRIKLWSMRPSVLCCVSTLAYRMPCLETTLPCSLGYCTIATLISRPILRHHSRITLTITCTPCITTRIMALHHPRRPLATQTSLIRTVTIVMTTRTTGPGVWIRTPCTVMRRDRRWKGIIPRRHTRISTHLLQRRRFLRSFRRHQLK